jgi:hypothetical protein
MIPTNGANMKVVLGTILRDINDSEDMRLADGRNADGSEKTKPATARDIIQQALAGPVKGDDAMTFDDKMKLYRIGQKCRGEIVHFDLKERNTILDRVAKFFMSPFVVGQVSDLLDPPADTVAKPNGADTQAQAVQ